MMLTIRRSRLAWVGLLVWSMVGASTRAEDTKWQQRFSDRLPLLGHRNWIVIADSAYPFQSNPGIETIVTGDEHFTVLRTVLAGLKSAKHVRPVVYLDAELPHVPDEDAQGISAYRNGLDELLIGKQTLALTHEEIIRKLDQSAELYQVLILKTDLRLPYTSVFIQLDCGYWNREAEWRLREAMKADSQ